MATEKEASLVQTSVEERWLDTLSDNDFVSTNTDDMFEKAVELPADAFGDLFDKRASAHQGFSATLLRAQRK